MHVAMAPKAAKVAAKGRPKMAEELRVLQAELLAGLDDDSSGASDQGEQQAQQQGSAGRGRGRGAGSGSTASGVQPPQGPSGRGGGRGAGGRGASAGTAKKAASPSPRTTKESAVVLTEAVFLAAAAEGALDAVDSVEGVTQLLFRSRGLKSLSAPGTLDLFRLAGSLETLSLSHNQLSDLQPLSALASLVEINLNFNKVTDLSPLFECQLLERLFASSNEIVSISGLDARCKKLRELSLFGNRLEDSSAFLKTLQGLPELRRLDAAQNPCTSGPSHRYRLFETLPKLETLDGQKVGSFDKSMAKGFFEEASKDASVPGTPSKSMLMEDFSSSGPVAASPTSRPDTAPAACSRPPLLPGKSGMLSGPSGSPVAGSGGGLSLTPLLGQKLRSTRANRFDEVLTQSRDPSPDPDSGNPAGTLRVLKAHAENLKGQLETLQMERDNLRYQVKLVERDNYEATPVWLKERVELLELEVRAAPAVMSERDSLKARLAEVEHALAEVDRQAMAAPSSSSSRPGAKGIETVPEHGADDDEDLMEELSWEGKLLEKRLERARQYAGKLKQELLRAQLQSAHLRASPPQSAGKASLGQSGTSLASRISDDASKQSFPARPGTGLKGTIADVCASGVTGVAEEDLEDEDPEVAELLRANEARLRQMRDDMRDTATAIARGTFQAQTASPALPQEGVDVLRLGEGDGSEDQEWHGPG